MGVIPHPLFPVPPVDFTEHGKNMASRGYGCTSLQNLALKHKLKGEARRVFFKSCCVKCYDPDGKGLSEKNLGYVVTFKEILGNSKNPFP